MNTLKFYLKNIEFFENMNITEQKATFEIFLNCGRKELFEYFKNKYSHLKNIVFFTGAYNQEKVNEFTSWALIGDLFASMTEEDMFKTSNKNVIPFKLSIDKLNIGISYSHGTLDNTKESAHVLQIKAKRGGYGRNPIRPPYLFPLGKEHETHQNYSINIFS